MEDIQGPVTNEMLMEQINKIYALGADQLAVNRHPWVFIILLLLGFTAVHVLTLGFIKLMEHYHPRGRLYFWEYLIISLGLFLILFAIGNMNGFNIRLAE